MDQVIEGYVEDHKVTYEEALDKIYNSQLPRLLADEKKDILYLGKR
jgi:hypothetical protein